MREVHEGQSHDAVVADGTAENSTNNAGATAEDFVAASQINPEAFHAAAAPWLDEFLLGIYKNDTSSDASAVLDSAKSNPASLRGAGNIASNAPKSPGDTFASAFKEGVSFVVPVVV